MEVGGDGGAGEGHPFRHRQRVRTRVVVRTQVSHSLPSQTIRVYVRVLLDIGTPLGIASGHSLGSFEAFAFGCSASAAGAFSVGHVNSRKHRGNIG